ncbi:prenyltransferase [Allokutzneria sp. A3M-2-11 16]|uniref:prenyltransferase/squalene oxidase repeat-containing protein n=1 Tax=Allokutzneria sp. A3M-2-11 16 TaxID=2962043 RepID=UPI0020B86455|nr:prenyltransferase/squalene oxidase repeat-containing protein [Allokutzneria sp. A3M-2-11 16]MCP3805523.1 prenyltransferase [Allokutzneria sp. A3M-2-11 16]
MTDVAASLEAGAESLLCRQRPDGTIHFASSESATLGTVGATIALNLHSPKESAGHIRRGLAWLVRTQNADGGWGAVPGQFSEAVPTAAAVAAVEILGGEHHADTVAKGRSTLEALDGLDGIKDPVVAQLCRRFHAMAGWLDEGSAQRLPLWVVLLPSLRRKRISFRTAPYVGAALAQARANPGGPVNRLLTRIAKPVALGLLREIHRHEGGTGEVADDPWAAGLLAIGLVRAGEAPDLTDAIAGYLRASINDDGAWPAVNIGLTYSGFAMTGLADAGYAADERLTATAKLFHRTRQAEPFRVFDCPAGGWSYSGPRGWPVTLESAEILSALAALPGADQDEHLRDGARWLASRQDTRGSWSLWVKDTKLANDGPCPYITSQSVDVLLETGATGSDPRVDKAIRWLITQQREDGTFDALWYRGNTPGTSVVLGALARAGHADHEVARRARDWLLSTQLDDGSWSTGHGDPGTVEETAWALRALLAAGVDPGSDAVESAVSWLLAAQGKDGHWPEAPVSAYVRYCVHYPNGAITTGLALRALAAYRKATA